jgi:hypothetical protein
VTTVRGVRIGLSPARAVVLIVATLATLGTSVRCAAVLGVDKTYVLGDEGIRCAGGVDFCAAGAQECCLAADNSLSCVSAGSADPCPGGTDIACDDKSDCAVGLCCLHLDPGNAILGAACLAACPAGQANDSWQELCAPGTNTCARGTCRPLLVTTTPALASGWFSTCQR